MFHALSRWLNRGAADVVSRLPIPAYADERSMVKQLRSGRAPDGLSYPGSLDLMPAKLRSLPAKFYVSGNLELGGERLRRIGDGLKVKDRLSLRDCSLAALPLFEAKSLVLSHCSKIESLPEGVRLESLEISACGQVRELPAGLVLNWLVIRGCPNLRRLPADLQVKNLELINAAIEELPAISGLDHLSIKGCHRLARLPDTLHAGQVRLANLRKLAAVPAIHLRGISSRTHQGPTLELRNLPLITEITAPIHAAVVLVNGCASLHTFLPERFEIEELSVISCPRLQKLPPAFKGKALSLQNCTALNELPSPLILQNNHVHSLDITGCSSLTFEPAEMKLGGVVHLRGSGWERQPPSKLDFQIRHRGVRLEARQYFHPSTIDPDAALREQNAERRRVLLELYGLEKMLEHAQASVVHQDEDAGGPRKLLRMEAISRRDEPHVYLRCQCPSTGRVYVLRVPPTMRTCHQAAAWLAGYDDPARYRPILET